MKKASITPIHRRSYNRKRPPFVVLTGYMDRLKQLSKNFDKPDKPKQLDVAKSNQGTRRLSLNFMSGHFLGRIKSRYRPFFGHLLNLLDCSDNDGLNEPIKLSLLVFPSRFLLRLRFHTFNNYTKIKSCRF